MQGVGRAMEAVPKEAWLEIVRTATGTFKSLIHPITATTGGVGRWIHQKFDNKVEVEKVLLADGLLKAMKRIKAGGRSVNPKPNLSVIAPLIEGVSLANEVETREMWINLLSRELSCGEVHPEFINILKRLSPRDARLLAKVAEQSDAVKQKARVLRFMRPPHNPQSPQNPSEATRRLFSREKKRFDLSETVLISLNLVESENGLLLTKFGEQFLQAVSEPTKNRE